MSLFFVTSSRYVQEFISEPVPMHLQSCARGCITIFCKDHFMHAIMTERPVFERGQRGEEGSVLWSSLWLNTSGQQDCVKHNWCGNTSLDPGAVRWRTGKDHHGTRDRIVQHVDFLDAVTNLWRVLLADTGLTPWRLSGPTATPIMTQMTEAEVVKLGVNHIHSLRTGTLRSMLHNAHLMMHPTQQIEDKADRMFDGYVPAEHLPMLALHVRRTDKAKDADIKFYYNITSRKQRPVDSLWRFRLLIKELEENTNIEFKSFFLAADDKRYYEPEIIEAFQSMFKSRTTKPFVGVVAKRAGEVDCPTHTEGRPKCVDDHIAVAASVVAASRHSSYIVGMGGSGGTLCFVGTPTCTCAFCIGSHLTYMACGRCLLLCF